MTADTIVYNVHMIMTDNPNGITPKKLSELKCTVPVNGSAPKAVPADVVLPAEGR